MLLITKLIIIQQYGGNPVSLAVANAVLDVIETEDLPAKAIRVGKLLLDELMQLKAKYTLIGDVRGAGMFVGIDLVLDRITKEPATLQAEFIVAKLKEAKILMSTEGKYGNILKFKPPMVFDETNVAQLVAHLDQVLSVCEAFPRESNAKHLSLMSQSSLVSSCSSDSLESDEDSLISE